MAATGTGLREFEALSPKGLSTLGFLGGLCPLAFRSSLQEGLQEGLLLKKAPDRLAQQMEYLAPPWGLEGAVSRQSLPSP